MFCQVEGLLNNGPGYSSLLGKISDFRWDLLQQVIHNTASLSHAQVTPTTSSTRVFRNSKFAIFAFYLILLPIELYQELYGQFYST